MEETKLAPFVFISYSWEDEFHNSWVRKLAEDLVANGVEVRLDQWENKYGDDIPRFMDESGRTADRVLCILTPTYCEKANNLLGGVGYEYRNMTAVMFYNVKTNKFIPVLRKGTFDISFPTALSGRMALDMRCDKEYEDKLKSLLREIFNEPPYPKPKLGPRPKFD